MRLRCIRRSLLVAVLVATVVLALPAIARAASIYVSTVGSDTAGNGSFGNPYKTVQRAVDVASSGDDVYVGPGTFSSRITMKNGVSLSGAGATETTLTGTPFSSTIIADGIGASTSISGFTISGSEYGGIQCLNSSLTITDDTISGNRGGGIYCDNSSPTIAGNTINGNGSSGVSCLDDSSPTIVGNIIISNTINGNGCGIWCDNSSPAITNNTISGNGYDGIQCINSSSPTITGNTISWNNYGIECDNSSPVITGNTISESRWNGVYCSAGSSPLITNCTLDSHGGGGICCDNSSPTIAGNTINGHTINGYGDVGIQCVNSSSPIITNCTISGYVIYGIQCGNSSSPIITNCTISENWTGGIRCYDTFSSPTITNCIVWNPGATELTDCSATYSDVLGGAAGVGNINADPSFVNAAAGDFHLNADSPCIDVGTSVGAPATDKDGVHRPLGSGWDMGAYEYHPATCQLHYIAGANGSIVGSLAQTVNYGGGGSSVTASPATGYHFVEWSDHSTANPRTDTNVTSDATYTASFAINTYTLRYAPGPNGNLTGTTSQTVDYNGSGTPVTAVPDTANHYHFVNWSDGSTQNPRTDSSVTANVNVTANFGIYNTILLLDTGSNPSLGFGYAFSIGGRLQSGGAGLPGQEVILESKSTAAGASYQEISSQMTGAGGTFSFIQRPPNKTYYRVRFVAANGYATSISDRWVYARPRVYVRTPIAPLTMLHGTPRTVYGWLKPRHVAGRYPVRIYKWRRTSSGSWKSYGYMMARASNYSWYTKYSRAIRLPYAGKWRLRAYAPADSDHAATWSSGYDYVTVK